MQELAKTEDQCISLAIAEAHKSIPEDSNHRPRVGAVIVLNGHVLATTHRNENGTGSHAEYLALEKLEKANVSAEGTTVYTTLEPCMKRKGKAKIACAKRLIDAKVARVVYGLVDPHVTVRGTGILALRNHQIEVSTFGADAVKELEALNKDFIEAYYHGNPNQGFIDQTNSRRLDDWYVSINRIYRRQNLGRTASEIFGHLVEAASATGEVEHHRQTKDNAPTKFVVKSIAWWLSLCGAMGVRSVEELIWAKFPGVCPYCETSPHRDHCKTSQNSPNWPKLLNVGAQKKRPESLNEWQEMFAAIYPATAEASADYLYRRLNGEIGELAEAVRAFHTAPGLFLNEAPDVLAWLLQRSIALQRQGSLGSLQREFCTQYPDFCRACVSETCTCPTILPTTVGRLGGTIPSTAIGEGTRSIFMSVDEAADLFQS